MTSFPPPDRQPVAFEEQRAEPRPRTDPWAITMGIIGGVLLGTGLTFAILGFTGVLEEPVPSTLPPPPTVTAPPPTAPAPTLGEEVTAAGVAAVVIPSTVAVEVDSFLVAGSGSGVVYSAEGYIVTNHHVVDGAANINVVFADGARFEAEVVGSDPLTDIAVLLVDRPDLTPLALGSSDSLQIGQRAIAVGNPLGLAGGPTVTSGIVSALDRTLRPATGEQLYGLVQTDAPIALAPVVVRWWTVAAVSSASQPPLRSQTSVPRAWVSPFQSTSL